MRNYRRVCLFSKNYEGRTGNKENTGIKEGDLFKMKGGLGCPFHLVF